MSTIYNRRRGAKANKARKPRRCRQTFEQPTRQIVEGTVYTGNERCARLAPVNRYCSDHQQARAVVVAAPMSRKLLLAHRANQSAEAGRMAGTTHIKQPAWAKARMRRLRVFLQTHTGAMPHGWRPSWCDHEQKKCAQSSVLKAIKKLNPWAK